MAKTLLWLVKIQGERILLNHERHMAALIELSEVKKLADKLEET